MAKYVFFCFFTLICLQLVSAFPNKKQPTVTEKPHEISQDIEDAFAAIKNNITNLVMKVQDHPVVKDVSERIEQFAIDVSNMGKQLVRKL